jgi:hypothetical protein
LVLDLEQEEVVLAGPVVRDDFLVAMPELVPVPVMQDHHGIGHKGYRPQVQPEEHVRDNADNESGTSDPAL